MAEEIKIIVKQEMEGTALKDALEDSKKLEEAQKETVATPKPSTPTPPSPERVAEIRKRRQESYAKEREFEERRKAAEERAEAWNKTPMEGEGGEKAEAKAAAAAERKRVQEEKRQAAEERAQEALNERLVSQEEKRQASDARNEKAQSLLGQRKEIEGLGAGALAARAEGNPALAQSLEHEAALRAESLRLQQQLGVAEAEATAMARARAANEARIAELKAIEAAAAQKQALADKQSAIARAEASLVATRSTGSALGGAGLGGIGGMMSMGLDFMPLLALGAALGKVAQTYVEEAKIAAESRQEHAQAVARRGVIEGHNAAQAEGEASSNAVQLQRALEDAAGKKGTFENINPVSDWLMKGMQMFGAHVRTSGELAELKNDSLVERLRMDAPAAAAQARKKFDEGPGGLEVEKTKQELEGHLGIARAIGFQIDRQKAYNVALQAMGGDNASAESKKKANEIADIKIMGELRDEAMKFGSVVNARSGAGDIARAASNAQQFMVQNAKDVVSKLHEMHGTMKDQHQMVMNATRNRWGGR